MAFGWGSQICLHFSSKYLHEAKLASKEFQPCLCKALTESTQVHVALELSPTPFPLLLGGSREDSRHSTYTRFLSNMLHPLGTVLPAHPQNGRRVLLCLMGVIRQRYGAYHEWTQGVELGPMVEAAVNPISAP